MIVTAFVSDVFPSSVADTLHVPASGTISVHVPLIDVPLTDRLPFVAVTVAPDVTVTMICSSVPSVTAADNGKFLRVVSGAWAAVEIANANGGSF